MAVPITLGAANRILGMSRQAEFDPYWLPSRAFGECNSPAEFPPSFTSPYLIYIKMHAGIGRKFEVPQGSCYATRRKKFLRPKDA